jgi:sodium transport system permease protein
MMARAQSNQAQQTTPSARSGLVAIVQKELRRFFTDRRMVLTVLLLPAIMIFAIYSLVGNAMGSMFSVDEDYVPVAYAVNLPPSIGTLTDGAGLPLESLPTDEIEATKELIAEKSVDFLAIFPEGFDEAVERTAAEGASGKQPPQVELYYNSTRIESGMLYSKMTALLDSYKSSIVPLFVVNASADTYDLVTDRDQAGFTFASMLPMLIIMFLFSGAMGVAVESVAGEKERGTMATMLVTPLARWELALGKVLSLGFIALLNGLSSFIGVMLSLPQMMNVGGGAEDGGVTAAVYGIGDYAMLLGVTLTTVLVFVGLVSVVSAIARSVKEAGTLVAPLMILAMVIGVLGMFSQGAPTELWPYLIPIYSSVQSMVGIFSFSATPLLVCVTIAVNIVVSALCVLVLTRMFGSERIMFAR